MLTSKPTLLLSLSSIALLLSSLAPLTSALAQNNPRPGSQQVSPANAQPNPASNDWSDYPNISQQFMQGCVGSETIPQSQKAIKHNYCACAFNAYKARYTPQLFAAINSYAVKIGKEGSTLVNLMMKPELEQCAAQTGFGRS